MIVSKTHGVGVAIDRASIAVARPSFPTPLDRIDWSKSAVTVVESKDSLLIPPLVPEDLRDTDRKDQ